MLNFYPKMYYSGGGGGGGAGGSGGGSGSGGAGGAAGGGSAVGTGVGGLKVNNLCGEGGRNAINGSVFFLGSKLKSGLVLWARWKFKIEDSEIVLSGISVKPNK